MLERLFVAIVLAAVTLLIVATTGLADPSLGNVAPHRHWIDTPSGSVEVGPRVCDDPSLQSAFNQFHNNLHVASATSIGPAAPGLHNQQGAEIRPSGC